jgi:cytochrome c oxidase cbb3-type subunit 3
LGLWIIVRANSYLTQKLIQTEVEKQGLHLTEATGFGSVALPKGDDFWTRLRKKYWEDSVPVEREEEIVFHHSYDGIRELDNHLPPWWVNMFILTCIWGAVYMWYYHWGGNGPSQEEQYQEQVAVAKKEMVRVLAGKAESIDEGSVAALTDKTALADGQTIYKTLCAACHGQQGEGGVGPNMTDDHWIHGGGIKNIFKTVKYGVPEKGMIAWAAQLSPSDMQKVSSYILTLKGTNPPNAKAPQGEIWKEGGAVAPAPATTK